MKELSTEEKAKAYDEAKLRMSAAYNSNRCTIGFMNEIFPELKKSEESEDDESIRKELIDFIYDKTDTYELREKSNSWLAWLEKQGEHANFRNKIQVGDKVTRNKDGVLVNLSQLNRVAKKDEKQGAQTGNLTQQEAMDIAVAKCFNKQEPADKVEPKFHEGEWVVNIEYGNVVMVLEVSEDNYKLDYDEYTIGTLCTELVDSDYRLWDISKDAKAGDVLATKDAVFIFKHMDKAGLSLCKSYCEVIGNSELGFGFDFSINGVYPATKEQRDTLIKAINKAGYIFDFGTKELKKLI